MSELCVLVAYELRSYCETVAAALQALRPNVDVAVIEPEALELEMKRHAHLLVICERATPAIDEACMTWVELHPEGKSVSSVSVDGDLSTVKNIELSDLLWIIDTTLSLRNGF